MNEQSDGGGGGPAPEVSTRAGMPPPEVWTAHGDVEAARFAVMRELARRPDMSQRELSECLGLSLGKTHYVLHALLDKGLVKIHNFRRSRRKLAYAYVLTPSGLAEKVRLTRRFLARKESEFEALRETIATLRDELSWLEAAPGSSEPSLRSKTTP